MARSSPPAPADTTPPDSSAAPPIWLWNGQLVPEPAVRLSPRDRGLRFGDGLYETLRVHHGRVVRRREHLARMAEGLALLELDLDPEIVFEATILAELVARNGLAAGEGRLRLLVTRGPDPGSARPPARPLPTWLAQVEPLPPGAPPSDPRPLHLRTVALATPRPAAWASLKSLNHLPYVLAAAKAAREGADEALLVYEGWVKETTAANVFWVRAGAIVTPPPSEGLLAGVTRDLVIELAREEGMALIERPLRSAEVEAADELFATGSVSGIRGIATLDGRRLGQTTPGPITSALRAAYAAAIAAEVNAS